MEIKLFLEIVLSFLCLLALIIVVIFFIRKKDKGLNIDQLISNYNYQMNKDLETLELGNKKIDEIEK